MSDGLLDAWVAILAVIDTEIRRVLTNYLLAHDTVMDSA